MRVISLTNSRPARIGRRLMVDWGDGRGAVPEGIPDEVADGEVARVLQEKAGKRIRGWQAVEEREIEPRPRSAL
ncbi:MAG: hypothetical protein K8T26_10995 [Lentisphaerae bacterium]|nr:hypothetical protein [Lentisphaerota bacterium]